VCLVLANLWAHSSPQIATRTMLPNEVFALACRAHYEEQGLIVDETNGEFAHCPYPQGMGDSGYYLLHGHHQHQGILQSKDVGKCCFFVGHAKRWLRECDYFPDDYFELWSIYDQYSGENGRKVSSSFMLEKVGIFDPSFEEKIQKVRVRTGKLAVVNKTGIHNPDNKNIVLEASKYALENSVGIYDPLNEDKVQENRKRNGENAFTNKTGVFSEEYQEKHVEVGRQSGSQRWVSTVDGYESNAPRVASHNRRNGWDPNARVRIS
jgi:hypothetical protein